MARRSFLLGAWGVSLALVFAALPLRAQGAQDARRAAETITPDLVRHHVSVLAHDSLLGRWTPSPQLERAAQYIADQLRAAGLRPAGGSGTYFQRYPIDAIQLLPESASVWVTGAHSLRLTHGVDFAFPFNNWSDWTAAGGAVLLRGRLDARPAFDTTMMRGRVLLLPGGWGNLYERVSAWQPAAIVWLAPVPDAVLARLVRNQSRPTRIVRDRPGSPNFLLSYRAAAPLLSEARIDTTELQRSSADTALTATPLGDAVLHVTFRVRHLAHVEPSNVVAILDGSDPVLRNQYVVYTAHYDHLGTRDPVNGDTIANGADDNASGTSAVLSAAKAFAALRPRPRRSIMFVLVSGEEFLGEGSRYFVTHPPVPDSMMVADLNADMVGRNWKDTIVVFGRHDSDLGASIDHVVASHPELGVIPVDSSTRPNDSSDLYTWSDHLSFIRKGIPFLYFYSGMHDDYHRPSDSSDKIDTEKLARIGRLMFYTGLAIAEADQRPQWVPARFEKLVPKRQ